MVGLTIAYRLSKLGQRVVVIERESNAGKGVTAGGAGVIHVVQLPFGSLKSKLARRGNVMYDELCTDLGVKFDRMPALLVVRGWYRLPVLFFAFLYLKLELRGQFKVQLMRGGSLRELEPQLSGGVTSGVVVRGYGTVDAKSLVSRLVDQSQKSGVTFLFSCELKSAEVGGGSTTLKTSISDIRTTFVVNAAGLYSDDIARLLGKDLGRHEPGLGVMAVYSGLNLRNIVAPLPISIGSRTKGGALIPATDGTTVIGPTLRMTATKEDMAYTDADLRVLQAKFGPLIKSEGTLVRVYTGVRPLSPTKDFIIDFDPSRRVVNLVGIESPGLTAAPAIAEIVEGMIMGAKA